MADRALFLGWNRPLPGREQQANELFQKSMQFYAKVLSEGRIESFEPVLLAAHGGDLNGFVLLRGEAGKLDALREDEEFGGFVIEAGHCLDGFGVVHAYIGEGLMKLMGRWAKVIGE